MPKFMNEDDTPIVRVVLAAAFMHALLSNPDNDGDGYMPSRLVSSALGYADELIDVIKKQDREDRRNRGR